MRKETAIGVDHAVADVAKSWMAPPVPRRTRLVRPMRGSWVGSRPEASGRFRRTKARMNPPSRPSPSLNGACRRRCCQRSQRLRPFLLLRALSPDFPGVVRVGVPAVAADSEPETSTWSSEPGAADRPSSPRAAVADPEGCSARKDGSAAPVPSRSTPRQSRSVVLRARFRFGEPGQLASPTTTC